MNDPTDAEKLKEIRKLALRLERPPNRMVGSSHLAWDILEITKYGPGFEQYTDRDKPVVGDIECNATDCQGAIQFDHARRHGSCTHCAQTVSVDAKGGVSTSLATIYPSQRTAKMDLEYAQHAASGMWWRWRCARISPLWSFDGDDETADEALADIYDALDRYYEEHIAPQRPWWQWRWWR